MDLILFALFTQICYNFTEF